jgi:hypothetical protein
MNPQNWTRLTVVVAAAFTLIGCGGSSSARPSTTATVGAAGATLKAGQATLTIPANAITTPTQVTLREAEPEHQGRVERVEVEPHGLALSQPAHVSVRVDDSNARVKMHDDNDDLTEVEVEDRNHGEYKTDMSQLGDIEVELEHGAACTTACGAGEECDDGVCKPHVEDVHAKTCDPICDSGQECDDGVCKAHLEVEMEHGTATGAPGTVTCTPACATGLECDTTNGICKPHGKTI